MSNQRPVLSASTACLANETLEHALVRLSELGFGAVELLGFVGARHHIGDLPGAWLDDDEVVEGLADKLSSFTHLSTHAPFLALQLFTHNTGIRQESLRQLRAAIDGTGRLGGTVTAVHAHPRMFFSIEEQWPDLVDTFRRLGDHGEKAGVRIGIETMWPPTVNQYLRLIHDIDHPFVGSTLDIGHVAFAVPRDVQRTPEGAADHNDKLEAVMEGLGEKLFLFHVHDVRMVDWRDHREAGIEGCTVDWPRFVQTLKRVGYRGLLPLELEEEDREGALTRGRDFLQGLLDAELVDGQ